MHPDDATYRSGLARVVAAALLWGTIPLLSRQVHTSAFVLVFWRVTFAALALTGYLVASRRLGEFVRLPARKKGALAAMGALLGLNWVLFFSALARTDVAVAVLLGYCGPVFVAVLNPAVNGERFESRVLVPLVLALVGTAVIVGPREFELQDPGRLLGAALAFTSAFTYAIGVVSAKRLLKGIPASSFMLGQDITAAVLLLPAALLLPGPSTVTEWASLATLGAVLTAGTGFLFLSGLRAARADHVAVLTYAEPVSAVLLAALFLHEPVTAATFIGGLMVVIGGVMVARMEPTPGIDAPGPVMDVDTV